MKEVDPCIEVQLFEHKSPVKNIWVRIQWYYILLYGILSWECVINCQVRKTIWSMSTWNSNEHLQEERQKQWVILSTWTSVEKTTWPRLKDSKFLHWSCWPFQISEGETKVDQCFQIWSQSRRTEELKVLRKSGMKWPHVSSHQSNSYPVLILWQVLTDL